MRQAIELAWTARARSSPNPWVGAVLVAVGGRSFGAATQEPGGPHAEAQVLSAAGGEARGSTLYVTLEPCAHYGRTPPCADAIVEAGVRRAVVALEDPDPLVSGRGIERLRLGGLEVTTGLEAGAVAAQLAPYLKHRRTGRPWVVLKLASTLDGRIAAPDGGSQWITGPEARADAHRLRAESDAVVVGAGTVRLDDPRLTVRHVEGRDPLRVVLGRPPAGARVEPAMVHTGALGPLLEDLGSQGVVQVLVEGGAHVAWSFHHEGLVDQYVIYLAPALLGGDDGLPLFAGPGAPTMGELWRGRFAAVTPLGPDLRIDLLASDAS
jgi:diaminohydroxyphosphoribosylaminopyrimidine deaminase/5-amino-6-(5-phosphoribosylamino)uracil reductase